MDALEISLNNATSTSPYIEFSHKYKVVSQADYILFLKVLVLFCLGLAMTGIMGNILNIRTFYILGLNDGVTISFFTLSIFDLIIACSYLMKKVSTVMTILEYENLEWFPIHPAVFLVFAGNVGLMFSYISMFNITFVALARCLCVAMPMRFKHIFTTFRSVVIVTIFACIATGSYIPVFVNMGIKKRFDAPKNASRLYLSFTPYREQIKDIVWLIFETIAPLIVEVILLVCVAVMIYKLRESAEFRNSHGSASADASGGKTKTGKLNSRDLRVVTQVILVSIIYILINIPKIVNALSTLMDPAFDHFKKYHYLYYILNDIRSLSECINGAANFFVYYNFNSAFRTACFRHKS